MTLKKPQTALLHSDYQAPEPFGGLNTPVHHASTITFANVASMRARDWRRNDGYTYGLHGTPTTFTLEQQIAALEGAQYCVLAPSGLAAIMMTNFALLKSGDEVLIPDNAYAPSRELADTLLRNFGIAARYYDPLIGAGMADLIAEHTRLIWIEAPGSVTMEVPDVPAMVAAARQKNVVTAIDNTWAAGVLLRPFDVGVDIAMHALTKYPSGASDVLMGSVTTCDHSLYQRIKAAHMRLGLGVGGDDAYLVLRNLPTMYLRLQQHQRGALHLAHWFKSRPEVRKVLHPAFSDCPGHEFWQRDFSGAGGLFSVILDAHISQIQVDTMIDALRLFRIGFSWGGAHSLVMPYELHSTRTAVPWREAGKLVRFFVGLEDPDDLIADLEQAFVHLNGRTIV